MDLEGIEERIDVLRLTIFKLLQNADFVESLLDAVVFSDSVDLIVLGIHVDDFQGHDAIVLDVHTIIG